MVTAVLYFVLAGVCLVRAQSDYCTTQRKGDTTFAKRIPLAKKILIPPFRYWDVPLENICNNAGVEVTVCDPNGPPPPSVIIQNNFDVTVHRNPKLILLPATVNAAIYCYEPCIIKEDDVKLKKPLPWTNKPFVEHPFSVMGSNFRF